MDETVLRQRRTFALELEDRVAEHPDKTFLQFDDDPVTFREALEGARSAANQLLSLGVEPGDTVALFTKSCRQWLTTWLGCTLVGAISMPINVMFRGEFLRHQLADSTAKLILLDADFVPQVSEVIGALPDLGTVLLRGVAPDQVSLGASKVLDAAVLEQGARDAVGGGRPHAWNEVACLFYTSGTTGPSKGALLTQNYLCIAARVLEDAYGMTKDDVIYAAMPLFHLGGVYAVVINSLVSGRTAYLDSGFHPAQCWDRVRQHGATVFIGVGPMIAMLAMLPPDPRDAELPLRLIIGSPVPAPMQEAFEARYGCRVMQAYGQTEAIPVALTRADDPSAPGSAGRVGPLHEVRIVDDDDADVAPGATGEIVIRPSYAHVMFEGYRNRPDATLAQFRNLWYHTGDLGRIDENGDLWWVDRLKDAIRRRGENISSFEIEQVAVTHPAVLEVAAHGVASPLGEQDVKLCVVAADGMTVDPEDLVRHCAERMPAFAVPRYIEVFETLPKNAVGRVQKHVLRERPLGDAVWDRER